MSAPEFEDVKVISVVIPLSILFYDYLLTISAEVEHFWFGGISWASVLFFLNRYLGVLGNIPFAFQYFWTPSQKKFHEHSAQEERIVVCAALSQYHQFFGMVMQIVVAALLFTRLWALFHHNRIIMSGIILYTLGCIALSVVFTFGSTPKESPVDPGEFPLIGCPIQILAPGIIHRYAAAWAGLLAFDVMVFVMSLYKCIQLSMVRDPFDAGRWTFRPPRFLITFMRDGTLYFGVMLMSNLANIILFLNASDTVPGAILAVWTNTISIAMSSRVMLSLRQTTSSFNTGTTDDDDDDTALATLTTVGPSGMALTDTFLEEDSYWSTNPNSSQRDPNESHRQP